MIEFRYHLVSLISVFIALAIGIVLGAGPLQGAIGQQLTEEIDLLRTQRNDARTEVIDLQRAAAGQSEFVTAIGPTLVTGALTGQQIAILQVGEVPNAQFRAVTDMLATAGGTIIANTHLEPGREGFNSELLVNEIQEMDLRYKMAALVPALPADASAEAVVGAAIGFALNAGDTIDTRRAAAENLQAQIAEAGWLTWRGQQHTPATMILVLAPSSEPQNYDISLENIPVGMSFAAPTVVAGATANRDDFVTAVRGRERDALLLSTVTGMEHPAGQVKIPLVLAAVGVGEFGHFGFEAEASVLPNSAWFKVPPLPASEATDAGAVPDTSEVVSANYAPEEAAAIVDAAAPGE